MAEVRLPGAYHLLWIGMLAELICGERVCFKLIDALLLLYKSGQPQWLVIKAEWFITLHIYIYIFFNVIVSVFALITTVPGAPEVFVQQAGGSVVMLSWDLKRKNGIITKYTVAYFNVDDNSNKEILTTAETELRIEKLVPGKTYEFQVKNRM